jgi:hypothetical protein
MLQAVSEALHHLNNTLVLQLDLGMVLTKILVPQADLEEFLLTSMEFLILHAVSEALPHLSSMEPLV